MKRKIGYLIIFCVTFFSFLFSVEAASLSISTNAKSVTTGGKVTITVKVSGLAGKFSVTSSNGNVLSGGTSSVWLENESKSYQFSAKTVGTATITVTPVDVADSNGNPYTAKKSVTVTVVKPREKSKNNNLKSLSVEGYTLSPTFQKDTLDYTVTVESSVEKVKINATKEDSYASIEGIGEKDVLEGDNKFSIKVTSETGVSKVYNVNVVVKDSNPITVEVEGKDYTVVKRKSSLTAPDSFLETTVTIQDMEIPAYYNETTNITLVGLKDSNGEIAYYRYDISSQTYQKYDFVSAKEKTIIFESSDEEIEGYTKKKVMISEKEVTAYQNDINPDYLLIYGMDLETGNKGWYSYHIKEESIQTYMGDIFDYLQSEHDNSIKEYKKALLMMAGVAIFLLLLLVIEIVLKSRMKHKFVERIKQLRKDDTTSDFIQDSKGQVENLIEDKVEEKEASEKVEEKKETEEGKQEEVKTEDKEKKKTDEGKKEKKKKK